MATTTARPTGAVRRTTTLDSTPSASSASSAIASPFDSPAQSPSTTSLSSLGSDDETLLKDQRGRLIDGNGNEFKVPDYTIKQIRDAIPAHCFQRSAATGLYYVARDIASLALTFYIFHNYVTPENVPSYPLRAGLWAFYTFLQGLFGTGMWVLAHECGHQAFSPSKTLNDTVGWVLHSALLVPYFSWKISHGKHHKATGNMDRDMVFLPRTREEHASKVGMAIHELHELAEDTPIATLGYLITQQLGGWPAYLIQNVTGHNNHHKQTEGKGVGKFNGYGGGVNHFMPSSPLYEKKDEHLILLSDLGLLIAGSVLYLLGSKFGWANLAVWYFVPYLWVNHWLVMITFLQHTDPSLPHYEGHTWTFTRGAAATIDREFGFIGRQLLHGIIETHVLHHYISTIPFYHADEATEAIKEVMGEHYRADVKDGSWGFIRALYNNARHCQWVEPSAEAKGEGKGVLFFRNNNNMGPKPTVMPAPSANGMKIGADSDSE